MKVVRVGDLVMTNGYGKDVGFVISVVQTTKMMSGYSAHVLWHTGVVNSIDATHVQTVGSPK